MPSSCFSHFDNARVAARAYSCKIKENKLNYHRLNHVWLDDKLLHFDYISNPINKENEFQMTFYEETSVADQKHVLIFKYKTRVFELR